MDHGRFDHDFDDSFDDDGIADEDMLMVLDKLETAPVFPAPSAHPGPPNPLPNPPDRGNQGRSLAPNPSLTRNQLLAQISPEWPNHGAVSAVSASSANSGKGQGPGLFRTGSSSTTLRQTTLWGTALPDDRPAQPSQPTTDCAFRSGLSPEKPTHHELDPDALRTWVYPTNLGATRDYQYSIVQKGLFHNTLVALPTGLGKTFIAATVMLNFYRWTKSAQIVFVAPTKPLVAQQIDACFNIVGIPKSDTAILTGSVGRDLRAVKWKRHRVFFMTPQTLMRDLASGIADPKKIVLLVVDEAHRATGEYAYAQVSRFMRRFSSSFRVLALTATPGAKIETVQEVIDNLGISQVEIRTEESLDIRQYVHPLSVDQHVLDHSAEILQVRLLLTKALKPMVDRLTEQNIHYGRDPMNFTTYGLMQAQKEWFASQPRGLNAGLKHMIRAVFSVLTGLAHSIKLLNFHGIRPFYDNMVQLRSETEAKAGKGSKYKTQLVADPSFVEMMDAILVWLNTDPAGYLGHPKMPLMTDTILAHFLGHGDDSATKVIVFSEFRDSAEEIVRVLGHHKPTIRPAVFVGQADSKRSGGMKQSQQLEAIRKFKEGEYNVLVATSIGEEGLDIGQVDLIVCYDASSSPIRMLQRAGRTGRKRAGRIVLLLMRGKEEEAYRRSRANYDMMQKLICDGTQFNFRSDLSTRIVPRDIRPVVDRRPIEIPAENTQDPAPTKAKKERTVAAAKGKKPGKKFHMPDGVNPNFVKASMLSIDGSMPPPEPAAATARTPRLRQETDHLTELPPLDQVVLSRQDEAKLKCRFGVPSLRDGADAKASSAPSLGAHPAFQRRLGAWARFGHSERTVRCVRLFQTMAELQSTGASADILDRSVDHSRYRDISANDFAPDSEDEKDSSKKRGRQGAVAADAAAKEERSPKRPRLNFTAGASRRGGGNKCPAEPASDTEDDGRPADQPPPVARGAPGRRKPRTKGGGRRRQGAAGINSDEMGDDCGMDGNGVETDGSDDGADLADFVVSDDGDLSIVDELAGSTPPPGTAASSGPGDLSDARGHGIDGGLPSTPGSAEMSDSILPAAATVRQRVRVAVLDSDEE